MTKRDLYSERMHDGQVRYWCSCGWSLVGEERLARHQRDCVEYAAGEGLLRPAVRGVGPYKGVVKNGRGRVVAECDHWHRNRDAGSAFAGESARSCARRLLHDLSPKVVR